MILWLFTEVFSAKFGGWCPLAWQNRAIRESFLCGNGIFHQFTKIFSLKRFLLYGSITSHHSLKVLVYVGHMPYQSWALFSSMFFSHSPMYITEGCQAFATCVAQGHGQEMKHSGGMAETFIHGLVCVSP